MTECYSPGENSTQRNTVGPWTAFGRQRPSVTCLHMFTIQKNMEKVSVSFKGRLTIHQFNCQTHLKMMHLQKLNYNACIFHKHRAFDKLSWSCVVRPICSPKLSWLGGPAPRIVDHLCHQSQPFLRPLFTHTYNLPATIETNDDQNDY